MSQTILITGGAGFIGSNLADRFLQQGRKVIAFDNFSRYGAVHNTEWLRSNHGDAFSVIRGDVRDPGKEFQRAVEKADVVLHLAAQVAVTTSVTDPRTDFEINALGTFNVLEAVRQSRSRPIVLYSSTNKVYGKMQNVETLERNGAYAYKDLPFGIDESYPLDFYSPYGCSKGAGDQYVLDYARLYGLRTVVFRQSCIYGPRQFGIEDQGWIAWFTIASMQNMPVTIFGDGKQVRDVLYIGDLAAAFDGAIRNIEHTAGQVYNIGGGPGNVLSLLQLVKILNRELPRPVRYSFDQWRPGDQHVFISDIRKAQRDFGWTPQVGVNQGVTELIKWTRQNEQLFSAQQAVGA